MVHSPLPVLEHSHEFHPTSMLIVIYRSPAPASTTAVLRTCHHHHLLRLRQPPLLSSSSPKLSCNQSASISSSSPPRISSLAVSTPLQRHSQLPPPQLHHFLPLERRKEDVKKKDYASVPMANLKPPPLFSPPHPNSVSHIHQHQHPSPLAHLRLVPLDIPEPQARPFPITHRTTPNSAQSLAVTASYRKWRRPRVKRAAWRWWG
ncbi:hypothetical protein BJ165DRAFT_1535170 [Panaeolus papilionaceus]|nr:hypothetical protein BJ165DRAFT_1535170 [Panaeolus papilionaceus]